MQFLVPASIVLMFAAQVSRSNGSTIELVRDFPESGHSQNVVHLFSGKKNVLRFRLTPAPEKGALAQLYQQAGSHLAPVGQPISLTGELGGDLKIQLTLPKHQVETRYLLVFDLPEKPRVVIKAHPQEILSSLKKLTKHTPLILIEPPGGLAKNLRDLGITNRVTNQPEGKAGQIVIDFGLDRVRIGELKMARLILPEKQEGLLKEVWMNSREDIWQVRVPWSSFDSAHLKTAEGQANLVRYLMSIPR